MAYSLIDQLTHDLNWYFTDRFNRLCVAASGGGLLPKRIVENDENNDLFHSIILERPREFKVARNDNIISQIQGIENQDIEAYFRDFEVLASRGLFVFDKLNLQEPENGYYILAAYPIYNTRNDPYPIDRKHLHLIQRVNRAIISRTNSSFSKKNFQPLDLITIFK